MPPAPPTFSMITGRPSTSESRGMRMRPSTSSAPPAANGITMVTGRDGHSCATAGVPINTHDNKVPIAILVISPRQRIGAKLELHHFGQRAFAAFSVERRAVAVGRPQSLAFPTAIRIVDPPVEAL